MSIRSLLARAARAVTGDAHETTLELREGVLEDIAARALEFSAPFPFGAVRVVVRASAPEAAQRYRAALVDEAPLAPKVRRRMQKDGLRPPPDLRVDVEIGDGWPEGITAPPSGDVAVVFEKGAAPSEREAPPPEATGQTAPLALRVVSGRAEPAVLPLTGATVRIGRGREHALARGGARVNDLAFADPAEATGLTDAERAASDGVGRTHASLVFDPSAGAWRVVPEGQPVTHVRDGRRVLVRSEHQRAFLRLGDGLELGGAALEVVASGGGA